MNRSEFNTYWLPARRAFVKYKGLPDAYHGLDGSKLLREFLGPVAIKEHKGHVGYAYDNPMDEDLRQTLIALAGPNSHAMFKILEIRSRGNDT